MSEETKICPFCAEEIKAAAIVCKHCGSRLGTGESQPQPPQAKMSPARPVPSNTVPVKEKNPAIGFVGMIVLFLLAPAVCFITGVNDGGFVLGILVGIVGAGILGYAIASGNIKLLG